MTAGLLAAAPIGASFLIRAGDPVPGLLAALRDDKEHAPPPDANVSPGNTYGPDAKPSGGNIAGQLVNTLI